MAVAETTKDLLANAPFKIDPATPTIGAWISGLDLREEQPDSVIAALRAALLEWKVIFFRDQPLTQVEHIAFGKRFGDLEVHPVTPKEQEHQEILRLVHDREKPGLENNWHSDVTWRPTPSMGSILRAVEIPPVGGDTLWANMEAGYDALPEEIKEKVTGLTASHDFMRAFAVRIPEERHEEFRAKTPIQHHPVIRTHPETGRRSIYVNIGFTTHIDGLEKEESDSLLDVLQKQAWKPEYQVRLRWEPSTIAFWDNRSSQHYATSDYWPATRIMERVTVAGDKPYFDPEA
jgi:taurine dioxygenase